MPINGFTILEYFRGVFNDLSITTGLVLALLYIRSLVTQNDIMIMGRASAIVIIIVCSILYISYFGFIEYDFYTLGFYPHMWMFAIALLVYSMFIFDKFMGIIWLCALFGFYYKIQLSSNLWDYLIDPGLLVLAIYSLFNFKKSESSNIITANP